MKENVILFGAGIEAEKLLRSIKQNVIAVIDNQKRGIWNGVPIISIQDYLEKYRDVEILIASILYARQMQEQLIENNIHNFIIPDELFECDDVLHDDEIAHKNWERYLGNLCDKKGAEILEVGSRRVVGSVRENFVNANYTGFDIYPGENVDVVGDAHRLSQYFDKKFDLIFSSAVFEHLAMPWIVSLEMIKLLKPGGYIFVETHYSFSSHERPWHFFQYSENALNVLFPEVFGIRCVKKGCSNLIRGEFSDKSSEYLRGRLVKGLYCHSEFLGQKIAEMDDLSWSSVSLGDVVGETMYPKPKEGQ